MTSEKEKTLPGGLLLVDLDGTILESPGFFRRALELDDRLSPTVYELFDTEHFPHLSFRRIYRRPGGVVEYHLTVHGRTDEHKGFRYWEVGEGRRPQGSPIAFYVVDDTSVLQASHREFQRLRRYVLDDVRAFVVDEFKNPISALHALAETARADRESMPEALERIDALVGEMSGVVAQMDEEFELSSENSIEGELPSKISSISQQAAGWSRGLVDIHTTLEEGNGEVYVEAAMIERVLQPVVENAVEASPDNSRVEIHVRRLPGGFVCFEVTDFGHGMSRQELIRAEDPFFSTKRGHAGLGLSQARGWLRSVGGYWNFKSKLSKGTTVRICVPSMSEDDFFR